MRLFKYIFLVVTALMLCFCDVDEDAVLDQEENIEYFLDTYDIEHDDLGGVYRYIPNAADNVDNELIEKNSSFSYYFEAYSFTTSKGSIFYTNKDYIIDALVSAGLNAADWDTEPIEAVLGKTDLLKGVTKGLEGVHRGDSVVLIMTSDYAYKDKVVGTLDAYSSIMYIATIQ